MARWAEKYIHKAGSRSENRRGVTYKKWVRFFTGMNEVKWNLLLKEKRRAKPVPRFNSEWATSQSLLSEDDRQTWDPETELDEDSESDDEVENAVTVRRAARPALSPQVATTSHQAQRRPPANDDNAIAADSSLENEQAEAMQVGPPTFSQAATEVKSAMVVRQLPFKDGFVAPECIIEFTLAQYEDVKKWGMLTKMKVAPDQITAIDDAIDEAIKESNAAGKCEDAKFIVKSKIQFHGFQNLIPTTFQILISTFFFQLRKLFAVKRLRSSDTRLRR